jgi:hypothetical protein
LEVTVLDDEGCALCGSTWGDYRTEIAGVLYRF